jgi:cytochrome c oxidase assembly factor CtaG
MTLLLAHAGDGHVGILSLHPLPIIALAGAVLLYARAVGILRERGRTVGGGQQLCFYLGLGLVAVALLSGLDPLGGTYLLSAHMAQHLLLADIAGPLLLIGVRAPLLYFFWPRPVLVAAARTKVLRLVWSRLTRPPVALATWLIVLYAWHLPVAYEAALRYEWVHILEHVSFAFTGILAWWPLLDPTHHRVEGRLWKAAYVVAARTLGGILGIVLIVAPAQLYSFYGDAGLHYGLSWRTDQQLAGAFMMALDFVVVSIGVIYFIALTAGSEEEARPAVEGSPTSAGQIFATSD